MQVARAATQGIWITDDVLADAFSRFLRLSRSRRRHGSNIPGPLEARRRLAKRKMGVAAVASGSVPPASPAGFDIGALFGLGRASPPDFEKGWKWEAPSAPIYKPPISMPSQPPLRSHKGHRLQDAAKEKRLAEFLTIPEDPVETSKAAFEALLGHRQGKDLLKLEDVQPMLDFLQSSSNEPDARLTHRLVQWLGTRPTNGQGLSAIASVVEEKYRLHTILLAEIADVLCALQSRADAVGSMTSIIDCLSPEWRTRVSNKVTQLILDLGGNTSYTRMQSWLACLSRCRFSETCWHSTDDTWRKVYDKIAPCFRPSDFSEHFSHLHRQDFAAILLRRWVPILANTSEVHLPVRQSHSLFNISNERSEWQATDRGIAKTLQWHQQHIGLEALTSEFDLWRKRSSNMVDEHGYSYKNALIGLCILLAKHRLPYDEVMAECFSFWQQTEPVNRLKQYTWDIHKHTAIHMPPPLAAKVMEYFFLTGHMEYAFHTFFLVPTLPLSKVAALPLNLIEKGRTHGEKIWQILNRQMGEDNIKMHERERFKLTLTQDHIDLVHLVAYAWAKSPHVNERVAFRRVWECYRFLQDRGAPLSALMTRALVRAGITRYLRNKERFVPLSRTRVNYIISIVKKVEGLHVAERLDKLVYGLWYSRHKKRIRDLVAFNLNGGKDWKAKVMEEQHEFVRLYGKVKRWAKHTGFQKHKDWFKLSFERRSVASAPVAKELRLHTTSQRRQQDAKKPMELMVFKPYTNSAAEVALVPLRRVNGRDKTSH